MSFTVTLPPDVAYELDVRVNAGEFESRDAAAAYFIRRGLSARGPGRGPPRPPVPPGRRDPDDDRPISVDPTDVNWAED